ncbi:MAG TPA: VOC family protein [Spirochaetia bacterium]|nr:VOC family protein [Spirochaetia bacterium]
MAVTGLGHLALNVSDMTRSAEFYTRVLGFQHLFELKDDKGNPWISYFKVGPGQFIELFYPRGEGPAATKAIVGFSHMCFVVDDIKRTEAEILRGGGTLDRPIKLGADGNYQMWVRDPDGNRIELMQIMPGSPQAKS